MSKKVVILNGSPRQTGNTSALVKPFRDGAESAGHTVTEFFLGTMDIHVCKGCLGGHSSRDCPCIQQDDMMQIHPAVKTCNMVVLANSLYYWTASGQLKTAPDRLFALEEGDGNQLRGNGRSSALLMAAESHGFEDAVAYYTHLLEHLRWKKTGHVPAGGNMDVGDIQDKPELRQAYEPGKFLYPKPSARMSKRFTKSPPFFAQFVGLLYRKKLFSRSVLMNHLSFLMLAFEIGNA